MTSVSRVRTFVRRWPRWLKSLVVSTVGVWVVYLIAANVILRTRLLRSWLRADDGSLVVEYASARSLFPGMVVVHGLAIGFQDETIQMAIAIDRASVDIDLWKLAARHTARFDTVRIDGLTYRLRRRLDPGPGNERLLAAFPPIEGLPPPIRSEPSSDPAWTIEVFDIRASVREVWAMEYRFRGDATVEGGFHLEPRRQVYVLPSVMRTRDGILSMGKHDFVTGHDWTIDTQIDPFVPQEPDGVAVLHYISFAVHQHGDVVSLKGPGETYLPSGLALEGGAGPLAVDVHVDHGIVQPDARVTYHAAMVGFRSPGLGGTGDLDLLAHVATGGAGPYVAAEAKTSQASLSPATALSALQGEVDLGGVDTTAPIVVARIAGRVGAARVGNIHAWQAIAPDSVTFTGGAVTTSAHASYQGGKLEGHVASTLEKVAMAVGPFSFVTSGKTSSEITSADVGKEIRLPGIRADLEDMSVKLLDGHGEHMWLRARSDDTRIATSGPAATDASIALVSGPGAENVKLFTRMSWVPDLAADLLHGHELDAKVHLRVRHDDVALGVETARNGILGVRGRIHMRAGHGLAGALLLSVGPVNAGLDLHGGEVSVRPLASGEWLDETLAKR